MILLRIRTKFSVSVVDAVLMYPEAKTDKENKKEPDSGENNAGYLAGRGWYPSKDDSTKCVDSDCQRSSKL